MRSRLVFATVIFGAAGASLACGSGSGDGGGGGFGNTGNTAAGGTGATGTGGGAGVAGQINIGGAAGSAGVAGAAGAAGVGSGGSGTGGSSTGGIGGVGTGGVGTGGVGTGGVGTGGVGTGGVGTGGVGTGGVGTGGVGTGGVGTGGTGGSGGGCQPQCAGKQCGPDTCGGQCGSCSSGQSCNGAGQCVCVPQCTGKACGSDGCGGVCGTCPNGLCSSTGQCVCVPLCPGKQCGSNGCGGTCGSCASGESCNSSGQCISNQQTVTLYATTDNTLIYSTTNAAAANTAYPSGDISVGCNWAAGYYTNDWVCGITAVRFDTSSLSGKTIISAKLRLYPYILPADYGTTYGVNAFVASWSGSTITFNNAPNYYTSYQTNVNPPTSTSLPLEWSITNIVKQWASGAWANNGLIVRDNNLTFPGYTAYRATSFDSINTATGIYRPALVVTYQ